MKMHPFVLAFALLGCASHSPTDPRRDADLASARAAFDQGDYDQTLALTDALSRRNPRDRDVRLLAANANLALARSGRSNAPQLLEDARQNLQRALEDGGGREPRDDARTWLQLSQVLLQLGEFDGGRDAALEAARLLRDAKAAPREVAEAVLVAADHETQLFVAARRPEQEADQEPTAATLTLAENALQRTAFAGQNGAPGRAAAKAALVYRWLGQPNRALGELERGIVAEPSSTEAHEAYVELHASLGRLAECAASYQKLVREQREPLLHWYTGLAQAKLADEHRGAGRFGEASAAYARAMDGFGAYGAMRPEHRASVREWLAILNLSLARVAIDQGNLDAGRDYAARAVDADPRAADYPDGKPVIVDAFGGHYLAALVRIGQGLVDRSDADALASSLRFYEQVIARHPDRFGMIYNNAGLSARDLGTAVANRAKDADPAQREALLAEAMALWEKSYGYYSKAVELEPDDARTINDCALMLVYHLKRDHARARALLDRAVERGKEQLAALPADAGEAERNFAEEALGDAHQNIAVLLRDQGRPFAEYRPFLREAVQYYPYQRREAAALLREAERDAAAAPAAGGQDPQPRAPRPQDPRAAAFTALLAEAKPKADAGDFDGALAVLDRARKELKGFAPYHHAYGSFSLRYAEAAIAGGGSKTQIDGLFTDAVANLKMAVEADGEPSPPRLDLARAQLATQDFAGAYATADSLLSHARSQGGGEPKLLADAHRVRAEAAMRVYVGARQGGADDAKALSAARGSFRELERGNALDERQALQWAVLEQWAGSPDAAGDVLLRSVKRLPQAQALLAQLVEVNTGARSRQAVDALASRSDATGLWFLGRARYNQAQHEWAGKPAEPAGALKILDAAIAAFTAAKRKEPGYAQSSDDWIALALGSKAVMHLGADDLAAAEAALLAALQASPGQFEQELGSGYTMKRAAQVLADKHYRKPDLPQAERVLRKVLELVPGDAALANNHGLFARDLGVQLERAGDDRAAKEMYEASYESYTLAAQLEPDSVRLLNDKALILLYHLGRDLDQARAWCQQAIDRGSAQLRDAPPADATERRALEEAVGDAWENLGWSLMEHARDFKAAKAALEKSLEYHPKAQRQSSRHLVELARRARAAASRPAGDK
jgi:tetratricopeptide (TPR) repeat protein